MMEDPNSQYQNQAPQPAPQPTPQPTPQYQNPQVFAEDTSPLSVGNYVVMILISLIPIVNIIMLFVWGFGNSNRNKKNWARAELIFVAIGIVLSIIFYSSIAAAFFSMGTHY